MVSIENDLAKERMPLPSWQRMIMWLVLMIAIAELGRDATAMLQYVPSHVQG